MTETSRITQSRTQGRTQINVVTFKEEDFDSEDEYTQVEAFPATQEKWKPGCPKKAGSPYMTKTPWVAQRAQEWEFDGDEQDKLFEEEVNRIIWEDTPMSEAPVSEGNKECKLRKSKKYGLDIWKEMEDMTIPVKIG